MKFQSDPHTIIKTPRGELKLFYPLYLKDRRWGKRRQLGDRRNKIIIPYWDGLGRCAHCGNKYNNHKDCRKIIKNYNKMLKTMEKEFPFISFVIKQSIIKTLENVNETNSQD